jgi:hypothetical protein
MNVCRNGYGNGFHEPDFLFPSRNNLFSPSFSPAGRKSLQGQAFGPILPAAICSEGP